MYKELIMKGKRGIVRGRERKRKMKMKKER